VSSVRCRTLQQTFFESIEKVHVAIAHPLPLRLTEIAWAACECVKKGDASARVTLQFLSGNTADQTPLQGVRAATSEGRRASVRDVLKVASQYAPCRITDADAPPSTQPLPGAPRAPAAQPAPLSLRAERSDVAAPSTPYQVQLQAQQLYRAVPPPRPASPTPVFPYPAYRAVTPTQASAPQVKRHESYYPVEVPVEVSGNVPLNDSSVFAVNVGSPTTRYVKKDALAGMAVFALVLGLLMVADRARPGHAASSASFASPVSQDAPRATTELPSVPQKPSTAIVSPVARGVDVSDLPISKGVDVSTLPLAPAHRARATH